MKFRFFKVLRVDILVGFVCAFISQHAIAEELVAPSEASQEKTVAGEAIEGQISNAKRRISQKQSEMAALFRSGEIEKGEDNFEIQMLRSEIKYLNLRISELLENEEYYKKEIINLRVKIARLSNFDNLTEKINKSELDRLDVAILEEKYDKAQMIARKIISGSLGDLKVSEASELYFISGNMSLYNGDLRNAKDHLLMSALIDPTNSDHVLSGFDFLMKIEALREAEMVSLVYDQFENNFQSKSRLAIIRFKMGEHKDSIRILNPYANILERYRDQQELYDILKISEILRYGDKYELAMSLLESEFAVAETNLYKALIDDERARVSLHGGDKVSASKFMENAVLRMERLEGLIREVNLANIYNNAHVLYSEIGDEVSALKYLEKFEKEVQDNKVGELAEVIRMNLAINYISAGRLDEAFQKLEGLDIILLRKYGKRNHLFGRLKFWYALAYLKIGDYESANRSINEAIAVLESYFDSDSHDVISARLLKQQINDNESAAFKNKVTYVVVVVIFIFLIIVKFVQVRRSRKANLRVVR